MTSNAARATLRDMSDLLVKYSDVWRTFQFDYVIVDAILLLGWIVLLFCLAERRALLFGAIVAPVLYAIDAGIWWNTQAAPGIFMREYWIGGVAVSHPAGELALQKFACDFMMTISYALFAFTWLWVAFRAIKWRSYNRAVLLGAVWLLAWLATPLLSQLLSIDDIEVRAVRHMGHAYYWWAAATLVGVLLLAIVYRRDARTPALVLGAGAIGALIMEVPLHLTGIRPFSPGFIAFEAAVLLNQAVPFLYVLYDKCWSQTGGSRNEWRRPGSTA